MDVTSIRASRDDLRIAYLAALAIVIHVVEASLPSPLPGIKPGMANVITVAVLFLYGLRTAVWVSLLRVLAGSVLIGSFLSPTFVMSLSGAVAALGALALGRGIPRLGPVGYSVLASMAHMATQFTVAFLLFIPHQALWRLFPVFMSAAVGFGLVNGIIALVMLRKIPSSVLEKMQADRLA